MNKYNEEKTFYNININGLIFTLTKGDLTVQDTDVIVNAANSQLWMGGGVAGAIYAKGGQKIQDECDFKVYKNKGEFKNGSVIPTTSGKMKYKEIFHAVGPIYRNGNYGEEDDLRECFKNCFELANEKEYSISIPPISSGIFGYPKEECAEIFFSELEKFIKNTPKFIVLNGNTEISVKNNLKYIGSNRTTKSFHLDSDLNFISQKKYKSKIELGPLKYISGQLKEEKIKVNLKKKKANSVSYLSKSNYKIMPNISVF